MKRTICLLIIFTLYFFVTATSAAILKTNVKKALTYFGYAYLPFCYLMFLRDILVVYLIDGSVIQVWLKQGPNWYLLIVPFIEVFITVIAIAWSLFLAYRLSEMVWVHENPNKQVEWEDALAGAVPHFLLLATLSWYWLSQMFGHTGAMFRALGIGPWVPFAIPLGIIALFFLLHRKRLIQPASWEVEK